MLDDQAELERIASMLASEGDITVDVSISGEAALDKLAISDFDAVISDYLRPPAMNGIDLLRNARARGYRGLFLMFTEKDDEEVALDAILNGADHFLPRCGAIGRDVAFIRSILHKRAHRSPEEGERRMVEGYRSVLMRVQDAFAYHQVIHCGAGEGSRSMIIDANRSFEGLLAPSADPVLGQNILELLDHEDGFDRRLAQAVRDVMSGGEEIQFTERSSTRDRWFSVLVHSSEVDHFTTFISDITPGRRAEKEVEAYRRKVALLGSSVRHDVLNQLTALNGYITLSQLKVEDKAVQEFLNKAAISGGRIRRIMERSREFEQLGSSPPEWTCVQKAAEQGVGQVSSEGTVVRVELHGLEVLADPHLNMVFRTLCDNAHRHGHAPEVRFFLETGDHGVRVICQDNGVGISPEKRKGLFSERLDHSLFLVKECLSITGLGIEERPMDGGACFQITVPAGRYRLV